jgi:hypothetical protein
MCLFTVYILLVYCLFTVYLLLVYCILTAYSAHRIFTTRPSCIVKDNRMLEEAEMSPVKSAQTNQLSDEGDGNEEAQKFDARELEKQVLLLIT